MKVRRQRLLRDALYMSAEKYPDKSALVVEGKPVTYRELLDSSLRMAAVLIKLGVKRGDRVAIYMDNSLPAVVAIYGTLLAGAVFLNINPETKKEKLHFILDDSESVVLVSDTRLSEHYGWAAERLPQLRAIISSGDSPDRGNGKTEIIPFAEVLKHNEPLAEPVFTIPNDLAAFIYTSGSTGFPKGVMQTNLAMVFAAHSISEYLRMSENDRILLVLPVSFDYGLYQLLMSVTLGATLVVERSFIYPAQIYNRIRAQEITVFPGVPTIYATLVASHRKSGISFPSVTRVTNTAAALPEEFLDYLKKIFPNALIFKMYGLTECKRVAYLEPELLDEKPGSVGKAIPGTEIFIRNSDGERAAANEPGLLFVRGPHVMAGYWKRPQETEKMLHPGFTPGERMLCTQDVMKMDEEGFLYFVGRTDDIIKTRGEKVSPVEIEEVIYSLDAVREAVVLGVPDESLGEAVRAFVVPAENRALSERDIKQVCAQKLENFMVPRDVIILDEMPLSPNGKIDKKKLAKWDTVEAAEQ